MRWLGVWSDLAASQDETEALGNRAAGRRENMSETNDACSEQGDGCVLTV